MTLLMTTNPSKEGEGRRSLGLRRPCYHRGHGSLQQLKTEKRGAVAITTRVCKLLILFFKSHYKALEVKVPNIQETTFYVNSISEQIRKLKAANIMVQYDRDTMQGFRKGQPESLGGGTPTESIPRKGAVVSPTQKGSSSSASPPVRASPRARVQKRPLDVE